MNILVLCGLGDAEEKVLGCNVFVRDDDRQKVREIEGFQEFIRCLV